MAEPRQLAPRWQAVIATLFPVLCLVPFLDKGIHIDDPLFVWAAQHIAKSPLDFYGFTINWYGFDEVMAVINQNPPGVSYYLALWGALWGWNEVGLHTAMLLPAALFGLGTWLLARLLCRQALAATLVAVSTPVFLVSATSLMADLLMTVGYLWAITAWLYGLKYQRPAWLVLAAVVMLLAALTKYFALSLLPLLAVYTWLYTRQRGYLALLLMPLTGVLGYEFLSSQLYGQGLLSNATGYASARSGLLQGQLLGNALPVLLFLGGSYLSLLLLAGFSHLIPTARRKMLTLTAPLLLLVLLLPAWMPDIANDALVAVSQLLQTVLLALAGIFIIVLSVREAKQYRNPDSVLLVLCVWGVLCFAWLFNWTVNARILLPLAPIVAILLFRHVADYRPSHLALAMLAGLGLSLVVTQADYALANTTRQAVRDLAAHYQNYPARVWFHGGWGFRYYMQHTALAEVNLLDSHIRRGDLVITPVNNTNTQLPEVLKLELQQAFTFAVPAWAATMNHIDGAGFYSHRWGMLPFVWGRRSQELYFVYVAQNSVDFSAFEHVRQY